MHRAYRLPGAAVSAALLVLGAPEVPHAQVRQVVLPNGRALELQTAKGLPIPFKSREIDVRDLGITVPGRFNPCDTSQAVSFTWLVQARVKASGEFRVAVTTPLDDSASTSFDTQGPGDLRQQFFAQREFPTIWAGAQSVDTAWFPFQFVFLDLERGTRFEFTQWAELDQGVFAEMHQLIDRVRKEHCK